MSDLPVRDRVQAIRLTAAELRFMDLTAELTNLLCGEIIGGGPTRAGDVNEAVGHIHSLQHLVMAQAAARAHPDRFRLLGGSVGGV